MDSYSKLKNFLIWKCIFLVLKATNRESVASGAGGHVGTAANEAEGVRIGATNLTAPIEAVATYSGERTIGMVAVARHRQFERRGKSAHVVILTPT
jgi:hypothetical protein